MNFFIYRHFFDIFADICIDCEMFMIILWFIRDDFQSPDSNRNRRTVLCYRHFELLMPLMLHLCDKFATAHIENVRNE